MKQHPITRRAFALSLITALALASINTVSAAETPIPKPHANAQEVQHRARAEEFLKVLKMEESIDQEFALASQMLPAQMATMGKCVPGDIKQLEQIMNQLKKEMSWDNIKGEYIKLYTETFSEHELKELVAFYKSPTGQAYIKKQEQAQMQLAEIVNKISDKPAPQPSGSAPKAVNPQEAQRRAMVEELLKDMKVQEQMDQLGKTKDWDNMKGEIIKLYTETFTEQELKDILAFHKSPTGKVFIKKEPELAMRSAELLDKILMQAAEKLQPKTDEPAKAELLKK
ncbi:MAG: DUF2059 domain-containing protein [Akkermansiaceae bacterium]|jgi:hypothetical protein